MFARTTAAELHSNERDYDEAKVVEVGRVKFDADEHPSGVRLIGTEYRAGAVTLHLEVGPSPAFGNDDEEPGYEMKLLVDATATVGVEL